MWPQLRYFESLVDFFLIGAFLQEDIGIVLKKQGKLAEAMELYQEVLRVRVATLGPEHPHVAATYTKYDPDFFSFLIIPDSMWSVLCSMGGVLDSQGKFPEALEVHNKALVIYLKIHGHRDMHPHVAATYNKYEVFFVLGWHS